MSAKGESRYVQESTIAGLCDQIGNPMGALFTAVSSSIYNGSRIIMILVDGGEMAVIFDRIKGVKKNAVGEGMHFLMPWLQRAIVFDIRTKPRNITSTTGSKGIDNFSFFDMQTVSLTLRVLHRPDTMHLPSVYSRLGLDYDETCPSFNWKRSP